MSSILSSQGMVLATAMAAVSGTVILLAFRLQNQSSQQVLRSCIPSEGRKRGKKKKRVKFAKDVVDPRGNGKEFRKQHGGGKVSSSPSSYSSSSGEFKKKTGRMPANWVPLYNGKMRDRVVQRLTYRY